MNRVHLLVAPFLFPATLAISGTGSSEPAVPLPGPARLLLPPVIHALEGLETNLYLENAFLLADPRRVLPDVSCGRGSQQSERWTWTPKAEDAGEHPLQLDLRDEENRVVSRASTVIRVGSRKVASPPPVERSILLIGDSLTAASVYPEQILALARADGYPLRLVGTRGPGVEEGKPPGPVRHEGYGGWTAERFATHYTGKARGGPRAECGSPFLYRDHPEDPDEKPFPDFARYCGEFNGGTGPDFVTILLGCNDTFSATDETIEETIGRFLKHTETLVAMIHGFRPETKIGLLLPMPPAASQDAFGANYGSGQTRWQYLRNRHRVVERMTETFRGREADRIFLVGAHLNLDPVHGFPSVRVPAHSRTAATIDRQSNGVHPSESGYRQIGDAVYAWLRSFDP
jgi:lysophospholipase L1-like esterase